VKHLRTLNYIADVVRSGSVRRTADRLNITPSALTRQIQDFEQELGTPIFERLAQGMRLNSAGELVIRYIRDQTSDLEEMRSRIADLQGVRRGHVAIACSQAFIDHVIPDEINTYRRQHGQVSFEIAVRDHTQAVKALVDYEVDLALILQPPPASELRILFAYQLPLCAMMGTHHPLAGKGPVRLRDCLTHPIAMPDHSLAVRHLLDAALVRASLSAEVVVESGSLEFLRAYVQREAVISFQVISGIPARETGLVARQIDARDLAPMHVVLGHLRGRTLSVAAAKFADQLANSLERFAAELNGT
jgi:DNA-binding transcriptional LysR family regulator